MTPNKFITLDECVLDSSREAPAQPDYSIPDAFEPVWFTFRRPTAPMPPHHLFLYHALSENRTLVYHFERIPDRDNIDNAARVVSIDRINDRTIVQAQDRFRLVMDNTIQAHPLAEEARKKILAWAMTSCRRGDISDAAYFPNIQGPPEKARMTYAASSAQFYFMNEFFASEVGSKLTAGLVSSKLVAAIVVPRIDLPCR